MRTPLEQAIGDMREAISYLEYQHDDDEEWPTSEAYQYAIMKSVLRFLVAQE